jgi:hypothetical protein
MKKNLFVLILIILSIFAIIYQTINNYKLTMSLKRQSIVFNNTLSDMSLLKENILNSWKIENTILTDSLIKDEDNNVIIKSNLIKRSPLLIFRFSELNCSTCIQDQLSLLSDLLQSNDINYIIISDYNSIRNLGIFKRVNAIKVPIYNCKQLLNRETITPYYFVLNKNGTISDFYYPDKKFPEISKEYLKLIHEKYFQVEVKNNLTSN